MSAGAFVVVGSGPAGVACARGLLERGASVLMLDAGLELEPERAAAAARLAAAPPDRWPPGAADVVRAPLELDASGVPLKRVFGSDWFSRVPAGAPSLRMSGAHALRSYARGGLSVAWGATFLPFAAEDTADWPVSSEELAPHYRAVLARVPLSARSDGLDELFPLYGAAPGALEPSARARGMLARMESGRGALADAGMVFGRARLAVRAAGDGACVSCGLCLHGCAYGSIWSARDELAALRSMPRFEYRAGVLVVEVSESATGVRLVCRTTDGAALPDVAAPRVFLAGGGLSTPLLLARSLKRGGELRVLSSQSFLLPMIADEPVEESAGVHTLAQVFVALRDRSVSRRLVQLQFYTFSDHMEAAVDGSVVGPLLRALPPLRRAVLSRLVVAQGLLHSDDSDALSLRVDAPDRFTLSGKVGARTRATARRVASRLASVRRETGLLPASPFLRLSSPGQSYHSGGTFPMSSGPGPATSDVWGRPGGLSRVHAVDATVLPSVPAPTFTLTVMANARRIALGDWG